MCMVSSHSKTIREHEREENNVVREGYKRGYSNLVNNNSSMKNILFMHNLLNKSCLDLL